MERGKKEDLTGQRFGRLTVISFNEEVTKQKKGRHSYWNCKCDCGNEKIVYSGNLKSGGTTSCGCYQKEISSNKTKEQWKNETFRQKRDRGIKEKWKNEEFRQMHIDIMTGEKGPNWKGGITPISIHLRKLTEQWCNDCKQQARYICELTGKVGCRLCVHHLKAFSIIVLEAHEIHNIQVKQQVKDYTEEELHKLEEYVVSCHKDNTNAVVLSEEVHRLFHSLYGQGNNTPEQYEEFKQRFLNGEFKEIIK